MYIHVHMSTRAYVCGLLRNEAMSIINKADSSRTNSRYPQILPVSTEKISLSITSLFNFATSCIYDQIQ